MPLKFFRLYLSNNIYESLLSLGHVGITSGGVNYLQAPTLLVFDGVTKKRITDVDLSYELGDKNGTIVKNTTSLNDVVPTIIPVNNSNGISISNIFLLYF